MPVIRWFMRHPKVLLGLGVLVLIFALPTWVYLLLLGVGIARYVYRRRKMKASRRQRVEAGRQRLDASPLRPTRPLERRKKEGRLRHVS